MYEIRFSKNLSAFKKICKRGIWNKICDSHAAMQEYFLESWSINIKKT